jgi:hypothetical protein
LSYRCGVLQEELVTVEEEARRKNKEEGEEEGARAENIKSQTPAPNLKRRLLLINCIILPRFRKYTRIHFILNCSMDPVYVDSASGVVVQRTPV